MWSEGKLADARLLAGDKHLMRPEVTFGAVTSTPVNFTQQGWRRPKACRNGLVWSEHRDSMVECWSCSSISGAEDS